MSTLQEVKEALAKTSEFLISSQLEDGTWDGAVRSDARATAFFLNTVRNTGRSSDKSIPKLEAFLKQEQLDCGGWEKWPGSGPNVDVTLVCALSLESCTSDDGVAAREGARQWLVNQKPPELDSFWLGYLALNGHLAWSETPHLSVRIVGHPNWVRPNIFDFSFLRLAVVATSIIQAIELKHVPDKVAKTHLPETPNTKAFKSWIKDWITDHTKRRSSPLEIISKIVRAVEAVFPSQKQFERAVNFLLQHQEDDGSFFSSVHMTSIAVVALHKLDSKLFEPQIQAGLQALRAWHRNERNGLSQQFTDSTTWDTILFLDLLQRIDGSRSKQNVERPRNYLIENQNFHRGDWFKRVDVAAGGAWCFQRVGKWYPDCDTTAFASLALLSHRDEVCRNASLEGAKWLVSMQCSNGGWASWDRNDRNWMKIPNGGPWFARDLPAVDITSRAILLLRRLLLDCDDLDEQLCKKFQRALASGAAWVENQEVQGKWYGSWFTHYLYGTSHALEMFRELGHARNSDTTIGWLRSIVNQDGGFGEAPDSGPENGYVAAPSTPFHTACGLLCLCFCGSADTAIAHSAANWLLENQDPEGTWTNNDFFAAGVPGLWYSNFSNTPTYFAAKSLHVYKKEREKMNC